MKACAEAIIDKLNERELKFQQREDSDGDVIIHFYLDQKPITIISTGDNGEYVQIVTHYEHVSDDKMTDMLLLSNSLNAQYKWLKFAIDRDNDLMIFTDAIVDVDTAGDEVFELVARRAVMMDEIKPKIMRTLYL